MDFHYTFCVTFSYNRKILQLFEEMDETENDGERALWSTQHNYAIPFNSGYFGMVSFNFIFVCWFVFTFYFLFQPKHNLPFLSLLQNRQLEWLTIYCCGKKQKNKCRWMNEMRNCNISKWLDVCVCVCLCVRPTRTKRIIVKFYYLLQYPWNATNTGCSWWNWKKFAHFSDTLFCVHIPW